MPELETAGAGDVSKQFPPLDFQEIGVTGLIHTAGFVREEFLRELQGRRGMRKFREMKDNDDIVGAMLYAIKSLARGVKWTIEPFDKDDQRDVENAVFIEECLFRDMDQTWEEVISETLSMLWAGWCWQEMVLKRRVGPLESDPSRRSFFTDGRIGFRKWGIRAQETLHRWDLAPDGEILGMRQIAAPTFLEVPIPANRSLLFRTETERNNPEGRSILRNAFRAWEFKKHIQETEGIGIERDLAGYPVLTVEKDGPNIWNSTEPAALTQKANLTKLYKSIRRDSQEGILKPWWLKVELLSTAGRRQFDTTKIITRYDQRIAMTTLTDFVLIGHDAVGSKALSVSKVRLFSHSLTGFLGGIAAVVNRHAIPQLFAFNGLPLDRPAMLKPGKTEDVDLQGIASYLKDLTGAGADIFPDEKLEDHLLDAASLPHDPDRDRGPTAVEEMKLMIEELKAAQREPGQVPPQLQGQPPPKQLTDGDLDDVRKLLGPVLLAIEARDRDIAMLRGTVEELRPLLDQGQNGDVVKALGAVVTRVEQIAIRPLPAPTVHVTVPARGPMRKKVIRDGKGLTAEIVEESIEGEPAT